MCVHMRVCVRVRALSFPDPACLLCSVRTGEEAVQVFVAVQSTQNLPTQSLARQVAEALIHEVTHHTPIMALRALRVDGHAIAMCFFSYVFLLLAVQYHELVTKMPHRDVCLLEFLLCQEGDLLPARISLQLAALGTLPSPFAFPRFLLLLASLSLVNEYFYADDTQLSETAELSERLMISQLGVNIDQLWEKVHMRQPLIPIINNRIQRHVHPYSEACHLLTQVFHAGAIAQPARVGAVQRADSARPLCGVVGPVFDSFD